MIHGQTLGEYTRVSREAIISSGKEITTVSSYCGHLSIGSYFAYAEMSSIRNIEIARSVNGDIVRRDAALGRGDVRSEICGVPSAGHRGDDAVGSHLPDSRVAGIGDV